MRKTIWSEGALPLVPEAYRPIYTVLLPVVDAGLLIFSIFAIVIGSRVVEDFTLHWFPIAWASAMTVGSVITPIGLVWQLEKLELAGKALLVGALVTYSIILSVYVFNGSTSSILSAILSLLVAFGLAFRAGQLIDQAGWKSALKGKGI